MSSVIELHSSELCVTDPDDAAVIKPVDLSGESPSSIRSSNDLDVSADVPHLGPSVECAVVVVDGE